MDESICSEEIGDDGAVVDAALALLVLREDDVLFLLGRVQFQEAGQVVASVAVVGRRPDRHDVFVLKQLLVALLDQLMGARDQTESVVVVELVHYSRAEQPPHSSVVLRPPFDILGIRPHQIPKRSFRGDLHLSVDLPNLINRMDIGRQPSMNTEDLI